MSEPRVEFAHGFSLGLQIQAYNVPQLFSGVVPPKAKQLKNLRDALAAEQLLGSRIPCHGSHGCLLIASARLESRQGFNW